MDERALKLLMLGSIPYLASWILGNLLYFSGFTEWLPIMFTLGGLSGSFLIITVAYYYGWGLPKCQFCGRPLEERREGSVVAYYCPVHGNVRGTIREG